MSNTFLPVAVNMVNTCRPEDVNLSLINSRKKGGSGRKRGKKREKEVERAAIQDCAS